MSEELEDAKTLAIWCSRSSALYNVGAWQAALLLRPKSFRRLVFAQLQEMDLPEDHPALAQWQIGLRCDCGLTVLPGGVFTEYRDGVDHTETACVLVADALEVGS